MRLKYIYFVTGASGVGKTTLFIDLKERYKDKKEWEFLHFDSIGVPSKEEMEKQFGSGEEWQRLMTHKWVEKFLSEYRDKERIFLEGQVNITFIIEAFERHNFKNYMIILVDCGEDEAMRRLVHERKQPELVHQDMKNWITFLRKQANELAVSILDTTKLSKTEMVTAFESLVAIT